MLTFVGTGGKITHVLERQDKTSSGTVVRTTGTEKSLKKLLTSDRECDIVNELSRKRRQRTLKTEQYVKP